MMLGQVLMRMDIWLLPGVGDTESGTIAGCRWQGRDICNQVI